MAPNFISMLESTVKFTYLRKYIESIYQINKKTRFGIFS